MATRDMHAGGGFDAQAAKREKQQQYQAELQAQIRKDQQASVSERRARLVHRLSR
jgi:hypothetical protein